jgi:tight adherence protein B
MAVALVAVALSSTAALAVAVLGATASIRHRRRRRIRRGLDENRALQTALDVLVGELRVGAHPVRAFSAAAAETGATEVGATLRAVAARARLGADVAAGLRSATAESGLVAHWERLAVCWQLAGEHGLAMSTLMRAAQRDIAERQRFSDQVNAGMAGARATAAILAGLPVLGVLLGQLLGAAPVRFLLGGNAGGGLLLAGMTLACVGLLWSDRITDSAHR